MHFTLPGTAIFNMLAIIRNPAAAPQNLTKPPISLVVVIHVTELQCGNRLLPLQKPTSVESITLTHMNLGLNPACVQSLTHLTTYVRLT